MNQQKIFSKEKMRTLKKMLLSKVENIYSSSIFCKFILKDRKISLLFKPKWVWQTWFRSISHAHSGSNHIFFQTGWQGWKLLLRVHRGSGVDVYQTWITAGAINMDYDGVNPEKKEPFRSSLLDTSWANFTKVKHFILSKNKYIDINVIIDGLYLIDLNVRTGLFMENLVTLFVLHVIPCLGTFSPSYWWWYEREKSNIRGSVWITQDTG